MNTFVELEFLTEATDIESVAASAKSKGRQISAVIHGFDTWANA